MKCLFVHAISGICNINMTHHCLCRAWSPDPGSVWQCMKILEAPTLHLQSPNLFIFQSLQVTGHRPCQQSKEGFSTTACRRIVNINYLKYTYMEETPGVTGKFGFGIRNEAGQRLIEFCQENALVIANTLFQQHKRRLYTWTSPDGQHRNQIDYILCSQ